MARKVRHWSTQSREPLPWYEHEEIGFNYRMSNILAASGGRSWRGCRRCASDVGQSETVRGELSIGLTGRRGHG